jgi:hypothetical protein
MDSSPLEPEPHLGIAVDASERSLEAPTLGRLLADSTAAPVGLMSVFPYDPLVDPADDIYTRAREEARNILVELGEEAGLVTRDAQVIAGNFAACEPQRGASNGPPRSSSWARPTAARRPPTSRRSGGAPPHGRGVPHCDRTPRLCPKIPRHGSRALVSPSTAQMSPDKPWLPHASSRGRPGPSCVRSAWRRMTSPTPWQGCDDCLTAAILAATRFGRPDGKGR